MQRSNHDLQAGGEMGSLVLEFDWSKTSLGPIETWPTSLRTIVGMMLHSRQPMFLWWGPELVQIYNDAYRPNLGVGDHPRVLGQRARDCWQEIWPIIWPQIDDVMSRARPSWNENALVPIVRNGRLEEVYWTYGYSPVFDDDGAIGGTLVVCTEATARVIGDRRRRILREVNERISLMTELADLIPRVIEALTECVHDIPFVVFYDLDQTTIATTNLQATHLDARAARAIEALVRPYLDAVPMKLALGQLPDDVGLPTGPWPEPVTELFATPVAKSRHHLTTFAVFGLSSRLSFDEDYRGFLVQLCEHIATARARIEAWRVRTIVEGERNNLLLQAPIATAVLTGPDHVFQLANPVYCKMVGRDDLVGRTYRDSFPEMVDTMMSQILDRVYRTGEPFVTGEMRVKLDRGGQGVIEDCYFRFNLEPMRDAAGGVHGMLAIGVDITEQVCARQTLEKSHAEREALLAELQEASRTKDAFLAMLGHELRNPLSPIVTALDWMKLSDDDHAAAILVVERQVHHLIHLVDDLLDVSRITRGQIDLVCELVELSVAIGRAIETASPLIEAGGHTLSVEVPAEGLLVDGDVTRLAQVVANLLNNAAKYTPQCGHIWIEAQRDNDQAVIRIRDDGVGIAPEMLDNIFDQFTQVPQDLARSQGGLGLGLSIVKTLTEKHGGTVTAHSEGRGHGSELIVRLPLASPRAALSSAPSARPALIEPKPDGDGPSLRRILIVDDNEDAAWILAETLAHIGHDVRCAHDGPSALLAALEHPPEIALIDIGLPVMDGYELAARLRAEPRVAGVRLIALTGYGQPGDRQRSKDAGFAAHLVKPVSLDVLVAAIDVMT